MLFCTYHLADMHMQNPQHKTQVWTIFGADSFNNQLKEAEPFSLFFYVLPLCCHYVETHIFKNSRRLTLAAEQEMNV